MNKLWRIGNHLSKMGWVPRKISRILELINHLICACSVSIDAEIGNRTIFYHRGIGCVVHPKAVIGEDCKIFQGVTIGSKWSKASCLGEAPRIGNNVMIGAGAVILGNITIGDDSIIGANAVVTHSIPKNSLAVGVPAIIKRSCVGRMKTEIYKHIEVLVNRYPVLNSVKDEIVEAYFLLVESYKNEGKLLIAGNGGSAADAEHIVGELMKGFKLPRKLNENFTDKLISENEELGTVLAESLQGALPAIALDGHPALSTAYMNDCEPLLCFAQQVNGYGKAGDVFLGISTSGNSKNILYAATTAHAKGMKVIGLTGAKDSKLTQMSDVCIKVPQTETYMIQELHLPVYHCLCLMLEDEFFVEN